MGFAVQPVNATSLQHSVHLLPVQLLDSMRRKVLVSLMVVVVAMLGVTMAQSGGSGPDSATGSQYMTR